MQIKETENKRVSCAQKWTRLHSKRELVKGFCLSSHIENAKECQKERQRKTLKSAKRINSLSYINHRNSSLCEGQMFYSKKKSRGKLCF